MVSIDRGIVADHTNLLPSFRWIQTWVTVRKRSIRVKISDFLSHVTLKFDGWPREIIGHLFYTTSSFVHHFKAIGEFKLESQSGNANLVKSAIFVPCDLEIWWMTLKSSRAPLLCCFKLCPSFHSHQSIQAWVTVQKRSIGSKSAIFCPVWPWNLTDDLEKE